MKCYQNITESGLLLIILLCVGCNGQNGRRPNCLSGLTVIGTTATSITLSWEFNCDDVTKVKYKVYYEHEVYKACQHRKRDSSRSSSGVGNTETSDTSLVLEGLNPYSEYSIRVKALVSRPSSSSRRRVPEERDVLGETLPGLPDVSPEPSRLMTRIGTTNLKFYWAAPAPSHCTGYNGPLGGFHYVLKGLEPWNVEELVEGTTATNNVEFADLAPYSTYALFVYVQNARGEINERVYLKQQNRTSDSVPNAPRAFKEEFGINDKGSARSARLLRWLPPYPPTGKVSFYQLRWKKANSSHWQDKADVHPSDALCTLRTGLGIHAYERPVCHIVKGLDPMQKYRFQLSAFNEGVAQPSSWTQELVSEGSTDEEILDATTLTIAVVAGLVGILFLLLMTALISYQCFKRRSSARGSYKNVPDYERRYFRSAGSSSLPPGPPRITSLTSSSSDTMRRYQLHLLPLDERPSRAGSIQEQPLPEVPKEEHLYEELKLKKKEEEMETDKQSDTEEYLKPTSLDVSRLRRQKSESSLAEDDYLPPRKLGDPNVSSDTIDVDDYLKPTFGRFERINSRDLSPPTEAPPPIPTISYQPVVKKEE